MSASPSCDSANSNIYAVILAGGHGERFWPLSRKARPKHHLALFSERSLLESTIERLTGFVDPNHILVLTGLDQADAVRALLPQLPAANLVVEPERRDTAAAMALAAGIIASRDPNAIAVVLPSDHHIPCSSSFQQTLRNAADVALSAGCIVTVGINPDWACPAFGYLELGEAVKSGQSANVEAFPVVKFHEKPTACVAKEYIARGNFRWNAGMFVWTVAALREALKQTSPALASFCDDLSNTNDINAFLAARFSQVPRISFDFAVMEKLSNAMAVQATFQWDDLGGWAAAGKYWPTDMDGNAGNASLQAVDARGNIVFSSNSLQHVALLGVENLIVVNTGDALLVCPKDQAERLKEIVATLPPSLR